MIVVGKALPRPTSSFCPLAAFSAIQEVASRCIEVRVKRGIETLYRAYSYESRCIEVRVKRPTRFVRVKVAE